MGTFEVRFTFVGDYDKLQDHLIDWYVRRGMDCTAYTASNGVGSADIDKTYLAAFCMIDQINVTSVKWDKEGITAWRPKRRIIASAARRRSPRRARQTVSRAPVKAAKTVPQRT